MDVIVTEGLGRAFGENIAVSQLTLSVRRGEVFGFLGPNGAGKTTTVRLLNGVLHPSEGKAWVLGLDVATQASEIRSQTGVLTETLSLYETLTARENLLMFGDLYGVSAEQLPRRASALLDEFGLGERADDRVGTYSRGMKQRLAVARALLHEPTLLFLDEPTSGLDPGAARMVTRMIQELSHREGRTIFMCTHNLAEAQRLCDRVGVIDRGVLQAVGAPQDLARQLWQGLWVEIDLRGEPSSRVNQALRSMPSVVERSMEGDRLLLRLDGEESIPEVVSTISMAGGRIFSVMPRQRTLEEIYFRIQGEDQPQNERAGE